MHIKHYEWLGEVVKLDFFTETLMKKERGKNSQAATDWERERRVRNRSSGLAGNFEDI